MSSKPYIIKPQAIIQDKRLTPVEADYLCLIAGLEKAGGCTASNNYFRKYFAVTRQTAQATIARLWEKKFVDRKELKSGDKTIERTLHIIDMDSRESLLMDSSANLPIDSSASLPMVSRKHNTELAAPDCEVGRKRATHILKEIKGESKSSSSPIFQEFLQNIPETETGVVLRQRLEAKPFLSSAFVRWLIEQAVSRFEKKVDLSETELDDWAEQFEKFGEEAFTKAIKQIRLSNNTKGNLPSIGEIVGVAKKIRGNQQPRAKQPRQKSWRDEIKEMSVEQLETTIEQKKGLPKSMQIGLKACEEELESRRKVA